ncbi:hypothetical protein AB0J90_01335 [Micromonospora sp. NPDC049523]|uniref:hypothetical protein n=1 Tax=Micromonospora sp. NPDC049523 TaxID=3155921 RepID=UPI003431F446
MQTQQILVFDVDDLDGSPATLAVEVPLSGNQEVQYASGNAVVARSTESLRAALGTVQPALREIRDALTAIAPDDVAPPARVRARRVLPYAAGVSNGGRWTGAVAASTTPARPVGIPDGRRTRTGSPGRAASVAHGGAPVHQPECRTEVQDVDDQQVVAEPIDQQRSGDHGGEQHRNRAELEQPTRHGPAPVQQAELGVG